MEDAAAPHPNEAAKHHNQCSSVSLVDHDEYRTRGINGSSWTLSQSRPSHTPAESTPIWFRKYSCAILAVIALITGSTDDGDGCTPPTHPWYETTFVGGPLSCQNLDTY